MFDTPATVTYDDSVSVVRRAKKTRKRDAQPTSPFVSVYDDELASEGFLKWYFLSKQVLERRRPFESFRQTVHVTVTKNGMDKEIVKGE